MATILDELAMHAKMRVVEARNREPLSVVRDSLIEDQKSPGWDMSVFRKES